MTFPSVRFLGTCALFAISAGAGAQQPRSPTIFSRASQVGTVNLRAAVVLDDYSVKPLPLMSVLARGSGHADSVAGRTNLDGRLTLKLPPGAYTIRAATPQPVGGRTYEWSVNVVVAAGASQAVELTNANASAGPAAVAASAPQPTRPRPEPAAPARPAVPASTPAERALPERAVADRAPAIDARNMERPRAESPAPAPAPAPASSAQPRQPSQPAQPASRAIVFRREAQAAPARANTSKLFLGLSLNGSAIRSDEVSSSMKSGGGMGLQVGWGFTRHFALVLDASAARIGTDVGDFDLGHFDIGARWHFSSPTRALVPFLEVALSGRAATEQDVLYYDELGNPYQGELAVLGGGFSLGGGLQYHVAPNWALGGSLKWTKGEFSQVKIDNVTIDGFEWDATTARFNLGFTWYPMR